MTFNYVLWKSQQDEQIKWKSTRPGICIGLSIIIIVIVVEVVSIITIINGIMVKKAEN